MTFDVPAEHVLFAESVRTAIGELGAAARARARRLGGRPGRRARGPARRGRMEPSCGRARSCSARPSPARSSSGALSPRPACSTSPPSAPRSGSRAARGTVEAPARCAVPRRGGGLALATPTDEGRAEPTLDGSGTILVELATASELEPVAAGACWRAWNAATLGYLAGLATRTLELAVEHARARGSSSARRWRRFRRCSPGSPTLRSHRMRSRSSRGPRPRTTTALRMATAVGGVGVLRRHGERTAGARRDRLCTRVRPARVLPAGSRAERVERRRRATRCADAQPGASRRHSSDWSSSSASSSQPSRASTIRIPPSSAIRSVRAFLLCPVGSAADPQELLEHALPVRSLALELLARLARARGATGRTCASAASLRTRRSGAVSRSHRADLGKPRLGDCVRLRVSRPRARSARSGRPRAAAPARDRSGCGSPATRRRATAGSA